MGHAKWHATFISSSRDPFCYPFYSFLSPYSIFVFVGHQRKHCLYSKALPHFINPELQRNWKIICVRCGSVLEHVGANIRNRPLDWISQIQQKHLFKATCSASSSDFPNAFPFFQGFLHAYSPPFSVHDRPKSPDPTFCDGINGINSPVRKASWSDTRSAKKATKPLYMIIFSSQLNYNILDHYCQMWSYMIIYSFCTSVTLFCVFLHSNILSLCFGC